VRSGRRSRLPNRTLGTSAPRLAAPDAGSSEFAAPESRSQDVVRHAVHAASTGAAPAAGACTPPCRRRRVGSRT
jgi:hypothetical protein